MDMLAADGKGSTKGVEEMNLPRVKTDTASGITIKAGSPIWVKVSWIAAVIALVFAVGAGAFIAGYGLAFSKTANLYAETSVLKAKAADLETEILHLKNYAVLIDAMAIQGQAVKELQRLPQPLAPDTSEPIEGGDETD